MPSEFNPRYPGRSSKPYNADGGVVSARAGSPSRFPNSSPLSILAGFPKRAHVTVLAVGENPQAFQSCASTITPAGSRSRRNECLPGETLRVHGERISSARSRRRCSRGSRGCSMHWRKAEASRLSASARWPRAGGRFACWNQKAARDCEKSAQPHNSWHGNRRANQAVKSGIRPNQKRANQIHELLGRHHCSRCSFLMMIAGVCYCISQTVFP